ncbi:hypothetical protein ACJ5NV_13605 [Loktanella agnita]|uniref:hypothetical protein n=1 Tax=Loktanella agnita TaxID=287097 RepID=UPI003987EB1C
MTAPGDIQPRLFSRDGVTYRISLPSWGQWLTILDRSARSTGSTDQADVGQLLRLWVAGSVQKELDGKAAPLGPIDTLPADLADDLVAEGSKALADLSTRLDIQQTDHAATGGVTITTTVGAYDLRPLSFGERNACLSRHIGLAHGQPEIDASAYEVALVATSLSGDQRPSHADLMALPLPLGETLVNAARQLSDTAPAAEIAAFAQAGQSHPDLELASLCLRFGLTPAEALALPANTARRLNVAAGLLQATQATLPAPAQPVDDDRTTRIVVHDD